MNPIDFIFLLLRKFVPIKETEYGSMKLEADAWHVKQIQEPQPGETESAFKKFYRQNSTKWYVKLALAVGWLAAIKMIADFMTEAKDEEKANGTDNW